MSIKQPRKRASGESKKGKKQHLYVIAEKANPYVAGESGTHGPRVQVLINFMNANLHRRIRLADLADVVYVSQSHLSHLFKTETGLSPGEYLRRLRMEKARDLLATSPLSIKEVMARAGYNSKSHFVRHFRRSFGVAPSQYRKSVSASQRLSNKTIVG